MKFVREVSNAFFRRGREKVDREHIKDNTRLFADKGTSSERGSHRKLAAGEHK